MRTSRISHTCAVILRHGYESVRACVWVRMRAREILLRVHTSRYRRDREVMICTCRYRDASRRRNDRGGGKKYDRTEILPRSAEFGSETKSANENRRGETIRKCKTIPAPTAKCFPEYEKKKKNGGYGHRTIFAPRS